MAKESVDVFHVRIRDESVEEERKVLVKEQQPYLDRLDALMDRLGDLRSLLDPVVRKVKKICDGN